MCIGEKQCVHRNERVSELSTQTQVGEEKEREREKTREILK